MENNPKQPREFKLKRSNKTLKERHRERGKTKKTHLRKRFKGQLLYIPNKILIFTRSSLPPFIHPHRLGLHRQRY
jgi:hypothetical protein